MHTSEQKFDVINVINDEEPQGRRMENDKPGNGINLTRRYQSPF